MTAVLARSFGFEKFDLIEDAIQEAMVRALRNWPFAGIPKSPEAWLITVARNCLIDAIRRDRRSEPIEGIETVAETEFKSGFASEFDEDVLRMMFACCNPRLSPDSQVALTLRTIGGFSVREIAAAFLASDDAIAKMLTRAKSKLSDTDLEIPGPDRIPSRLGQVLKVLYLMFNEGYNTSNGLLPVRNDFCFEAIRLAGILSRHPSTRHPKVDALLAMFFFQAARLEARFDEHGDILRLSEQDRQKWDRRMIARGLEHLKLSAAGDEVSEFHVEAEIASIHALSFDPAKTDWSRLVECYDRLLTIRWSPIVALNRAIAASKSIGPEAVLSEIDDLETSLAKYPFFHIARGEMLAGIGDSNGAAVSFRRAQELSGNDAMFRFLRRRVEQVENE